MSEKNFSERLLGRVVTYPKRGVIDMVYMAQDLTPGPGLQVTTSVPILVVRIEDTGELESFYVNKVRVETYAASNPLL